jgi:hypothetical protein
MTNIIGDIAGNYDTLMALIKKMPDEEVLSVGDMIDRGPKSKEVIEWFMKNGKAILGNHEHMMLDSQRHTGFYQDCTWLSNGARPTINSFGYHIPEEVVEWVAKLPLYVKMDGVLISHSFVAPRFTLEQACKVDVHWRDADYNIIWNRLCPERMDEIIQIAGHNSQFGLEHFSDQFGEYAVCIDASQQQVLVGINWPSMQIYQQAYIDI